jgi:CyaY protein
LLLLLLLRGRRRLAVGRGHVQGAFVPARRNHAGRRQRGYNAKDHAAECQVEHWELLILAGSIMTESEFLALIDQVLNSIESQADDWAASLDVDVETSRSGNVLTMVFEDNTHVVVNSQAAMQELWVAARSGGFHYRYDGQHWNDTRGGPQLPDALSQICSAAAGVPVTIRL